MNDLPEKLALLPDGTATRFLTSAVLFNQEPLPAAAIDQHATPTNWNARLVRQLFDEAMKRFDQDERTSADAWLAPVLHATLRLTRREASDSELWNYLALRVAPDYVYWRHLPFPTVKKPNPKVNKARFSGPYYSQVFSRLWWTAELFRDGSDYGPVVTACGNQDVPNTVLRLEMIRHRPTAQAMIRLLSTGVIRTGDDVNSLTRAVNSAGATVSYEALAPDLGPDPGAYRDWIDELASVLVPYDSLPTGPDDGRVRQAAVDTLATLFTQLFTESPSAGE